MESNDDICYISIQAHYLTIPENKTGLKLTKKIYLTLKDGFWRIFFGGVRIS